VEKQQHPAAFHLPKGEGKRAHFSLTNPLKACYHPEYQQLSSYFFLHLKKGGIIHER